MLAALLKPLGICASYLNAKVLPVSGNNNLFCLVNKGYLLLNPFNLVLVFLSHKTWSLVWKGNTAASLAWIFYLLIITTSRCFGAVWFFSRCTLYLYTVMVFVFSLQKVFSDVFEKTLGYIQELTNEDMKQKVLLQFMILALSIIVVTGQMWCQLKIIFFETNFILNVLCPLGIGDKGNWESTY